MATSSGGVQRSRRAAHHRGDRRRSPESVRGPRQDHLHLALPHRHHLLAHRGEYTNGRHEALQSELQSRRTLNYISSSSDCSRLLYPSQFATAFPRILGHEAYRYVHVNFSLFFSFHGGVGPGLWDPGWNGRISCPFRWVPKRNRIVP